MKKTSAYRTDELILIINNCESLTQLEQVLRGVIYLTSRNLQNIDNVICDISDKKEFELLNKLNYGNNN